MKLYYKAKKYQLFSHYTIIDPNSNEFLKIDKQLIYLLKKMNKNNLALSLYSCNGHVEQNIQPMIVLLYLHKNKNIILNKIKKYLNNTNIIFSNVPMFLCKDFKKTNRIWGLIYIHWNNGNVFKNQKMLHNIIKTLS